MEILKKIRAMKSVRKKAFREGKTIGFIPTMGSFHDGHLSLIRKCKKLTDISVASIYVNPTQFGEGEDLNRYPSNITRDADLAAKERLDFLFTPNSSDIYPEGYKTFVEVEEISSLLCGISRPEHFKGVCTVVLKLFNIVHPDFAFFGMKDAQQALIIRRMVMDLNLDVEIVVEPIVREDDGLAMSSRNQYLKTDERKSALSLYFSLKEAERMIENGEVRSDVIIQGITETIAANPINRIDYISVVDPETLKPVDKIRKNALITLAVFVGNTRLIDNIEIKR